MSDLEKATQDAFECLRPRINELIGRVEEGTHREAYIIAFQIGLQGDLEEVIQKGIEIGKKCNFCKKISEDSICSSCVAEAQGNARAEEHQKIKKILEKKLKGFNIKGLKERYRKKIQSEEWSLGFVEAIEELQKELDEK